jgi:hypothetical protein
MSDLHTSYQVGDNFLTAREAYLKLVTDYPGILEKGIKFCPKQKRKEGCGRSDGKDKPQQKKAKDA